MNYNKLPCQQIEDRAEDECHDAASEDDDVVWHAEIRSSEVNQQGGGIDPLAQGMTINSVAAVAKWHKYGGRKVPAALSVWLVISIS